MWEIIAGLPYGLFFTTVCKGVGMGFAAGALMVLLLAKGGLWRRDSRARNLAVKLFYLYIPVVLVATLTAWQVSALARSGVVAGMDSVRPQVNALSVQGAQTALAALSEAQVEVLEASPDALGGFLTAYVEDMAEPVICVLPAAARSIIRSIWGAATPVAAEKLKREVLALLGAHVGLNEEDFAAFMARGIVLSLEGGLLMDAVQFQVNKRFDGVNAWICLITGLLFVPVILEVVLYRLFRGGRGVL